MGVMVKVDKVGFSLFDKLDMQGVLIKDQKKDTLLSAKSFKLRISDLVFSTSSPMIKYIGLDGVTVYLNRTTEKWNYQFLIDLLKTDTSKKSDNIDVKKIDISHLHFVQNDKWDGQIMELNADNLLLNIKSVQGNKFNIDQININKPFYLVKSFNGLKPIKEINKKAKKIVPSLNELVFNPTHVNLYVNELQITSGKIWIEYGVQKPVSHFDVDHIRMNEINVSINHLKFIEDTISDKVL